jgi:hypothetical protein
VFPKVFAGVNLVLVCLQHRRDDPWAVSEEMCAENCVMGHNNPGILSLLPCHAGNTRRTCAAVMFVAYRDVMMSLLRAHGVV